MYSLEEALKIHSDAARRLLDSANAVPAGKWCEPIGDGKWSPGQIVAHLVSAYDIILGELQGGSGMRIRTRWWQRMLLRLFLVPKLLRGGPFPKNAIAPKETRPQGNVPEQSACLGTFRERAAQLDATARQARRDQQITHAYFGSASIANGIVLCARHIDHHRAQLPAPALSHPEHGKANASPTTDPARRA